MNLIRHLQQSFTSIMIFFLRVGLDQGIVKTQLSGYLEALVNPQNENKNYTESF